MPNHSWCYNLLGLCPPQLSTEMICLCLLFFGWMKEGEGRGVGGFVTFPFCWSCAYCPAICLWEIIVLICLQLPALCLWFSQNFSILVYANLCIAGAQIWKIFFSGLSLKTLVKRDEWRWDVQILTHSQNDFWWKLMPSESIFLFAGFRYFYRYKVHYRCSCFPTPQCSVYSGKVTVVFSTEGCYSREDMTHSSMTANTNTEQDFQ